MRIFRTPTKNGLTKAFLVIGILASPIVVASYFLIRDVLGDYGIADAIMIPIASYSICAFVPALILLVFGLRRYTSGISLFTWNGRRFWRSLGWTALLLPPLDWTWYMIFDAIDGRIYWVAVFSALYFYCLLVLRACLVSHEPKMLPNKADAPNPAMTSLIHGGGH
jgi:hypothetical protein